ncbi:hypothetical protein [Cardinium endosymbiont of Sogatella furcifera]|uniref:hypothetical protein n=1 Tax=Cardinium endosymbiont of Sogatella furcifera TaxID=650378 RepID=UPI000E0D5D77|nr:hypothetical protein [Cardinium endosymbiont of Sogatella furcifera]
MQNHTIKTKSSNLLVKGITVLAVPFALQVIAGCTMGQKYGVKNSLEGSNTDSQVNLNHFSSLDTTSLETINSKLQIYLKKGAEVCKVTFLINLVTNPEYLLNLDKKGRNILHNLSYYGKFSENDSLTIYENIYNKLPSLLEGSSNRLLDAFFRKDLKGRSVFSYMYGSKGRKRDNFIVINTFEKHVHASKRICFFISFLKAIKADFNPEDWKMLVDEMTDLRNKGMLHEDVYENLVSLVEKTKANEEMSRGDVKRQSSRKYSRKHKLNTVNLNSNSNSNNQIVDHLNSQDVNNNNSNNNTNLNNNVNNNEALQNTPNNNDNSNGNSNDQIVDDTDSKNVNNDSNNNSDL